MKQRDLEELIKRSKTGDRRAQEMLVAAVQDRVYYHCRKMLKSPEDAMDATQDILLSMLNGLGSLREPAAFWGWLNRMTSNICCKHINQDRREPSLWKEEPGGGPLSRYEDLDDQVVPDKVLDNEENRRMVVELVESLPEAQRLSVLFYYYDEMSVKEIAEAMETSENTVKSRLYYAREAIRKGVEKYAGQGFKLYGLTPVPYLRYFLQKEAANAAGIAAGKAALAAAAAASSASAAGGAAVTAALSKALSGALAHKGLVALAGLTLAGAVAGGAALHRPAAPAEEPKALAEIVPDTRPEPAAPAEPEAKALTFEPETPSSPEGLETPEEPLVTPPVWMGEAPAPEAAEEEPALQDAEPAPEEDRPPEAQPEPPEEEEPEAAGPEEEEPEEPEFREPDNRTPERDDDDDDDDDEDDDGGAPPAPVPDPEPKPDPVPDPEPETPVTPLPPAVSVQYEPNPDFGDYLGETADGVYEFLYSARLPDYGSRRYPFKPGEFYTRVQIENSMIVRTDGPYIYGIEEGETDVRYYVSEKEEGPYELKALVHVQVLRQPIEVNEGYRQIGMPNPAENGALLLERTFRADGTDQPLPLVFSKGYALKLESGNPAVLGVRAGTNRFYGIAPGTAEGRVYLRVGDSFPWELAARVNFKVEPIPEAPKQCEPREDFSPENGAEGAQEAAYQGVDDQGLYAFAVTVREGDVFHLQPLVEGTYEISVNVSGGSVLDIDNPVENTYRAVGSGDAKVTCTVRLEGEEAFRPCAVVYVHVLPTHAPYFPNPDFGECLGRDEQDVWHFKAELLTSGPSLPSALASGDYFLRTVSADPGIAAVRDGRLYGVSPGSVEVCYYVSKTEDEGYILQAVAQVEVKDPEPEPPEESFIPPGAQVVNLDVARFGRCSGYGFNYKFLYSWEDQSKDPLPSTLEYRSSDPEVIVVNEKGAFTTLSAGTAVLAAWDPGDPSICYTLTFQVEDHFDWTVYACDVEIPVGTETIAFVVDGYSKDYATKLVGFEWASGDPDLLTVSPINNVALGCRVLGHAPGTVTGTGTARFSLKTAEDRLVEMTDTFSFQVQVLP